MSTLTYRDAVAKALADSMREEPRLILIGQILPATRSSSSHRLMVPSACAIARLARARWLALLRARR